jgi:CBS domain-containing protein
MSEILHNQKPLTLPPTATVQEACKAMYKRRVGATLVTDPEGRLVGIFTGRDAVRVLANGKDSTTIRLQAVMTRRPQTMPPGRTAIEALRLMRDGGFRHVPVVDDELLLGVVSHGDFRGLEHDRIDVETSFWERIA